jgi:hypothetical protein
MKRIIALFVLALITSLSVLSQSTIPLSDNCLYYSSDNNIHLEKIKDSVYHSSKDIKINSKRFNINGSSLYQHFTRLNRIKPKEFDLYSVNSRPNRTSNKEANDLDTLYFSFDQDYSWLQTPEIYVSKSENIGGLTTPYWLNNTFGYFLLEHDTVDVLSIMLTGMDVNIVFQYDFVFDGDDTIFLSASQATHPIVMEPVDENGNNISSLEGFFRKKFTVSIDLTNGGDFITDWSWEGTSSFKVSDYFRGTMKLYFGSSLENYYFGSWPSYLIECPILDSIVDSVYFTNNPDSLVNVVSNFTYYKKRDFNKIGFGDFTKYVAWTGNYGISGMVSIYQDYAHPYWEGSMHISMQNCNELGYCFEHYLGCEINGDYKNYYASPYYDEYNDSLAGFYGFTPNADVHYCNNYDTLFIGKGLAFYQPAWTNTQAIIHSVSNNMGMWGNYIYPDTSTDKYVLKDLNGNIIVKGSGLEVYAYVTNHEPYILTQTNSFTHFNGFTGKSILTSYLDLGEKDFTPPVAAKIYLINENNTMKYDFNNSEKVILNFSAADFITYTTNHIGIGYQPLVDSLTDVFIKDHNSSKWIEVPVVRLFGDSVIGSFFRSDLTDYLDNDSAMYDLKFKIIDTLGNYAEYKFLPGFVYGNFTVGINHNTSSVSANTLFWPNPAKNLIHTENNKNGYHFFVNSLSGIKVFDGKIKNGTINISSIPSGVYTITFTKDGQITDSGKFVKIND